VGLVLSFGSISGDHATVEVVFGLEFSRPFSSKEIETIIIEHPKWKSHLPKLSRSSCTGSFQIKVGDGMAHHDVQVSSAGGVAFERFKPDGTLDWRLKVDESSFSVSCFSQTPWAEIWPLARLYIEDLAPLLDNIVIESLSLQYIDLFEWQGEGHAYNAHELFIAHTSPAMTGKRSSATLWKNHQQWFRNGEPAEICRFLERLHIDAAENEDFVPTIKIDTYLEAQLSTPIVFQDHRAWIVGMFEDLHLRQKALMGEMITSEVAGRINLDVSQNIGA
jgi:uncharacterized protein (TIGR04255 family)